MAATMAVATTGPIPGICRIRVQSASVAEIRSNSFFDHLPLTPKRAHLRRQISICVLEDIGHRFPELRWSLSEFHASFEQERNELRRKLLEFYLAKKKLGYHPFVGYCEWCLQKKIGNVAKTPGCKAHP
jgi:hypothetical protein